LQIVLDGSEANRTTTGDLPQPQAHFNLNLRTSLVLRTDNLLAGKRSSLSWGGYSPLCCPAPLALWKLIRRSRTRFRDRPKTVRLHPGSLFGIIPDWRSASSRNRVHVPPESPAKAHREPISEDCGGNWERRKRLRQWLTNSPDSYTGC
jgi:hypothetical protein